MKKTRILSLLLVCLCIVSAFFACGKKTEVNDSDSPAVKDSDTDSSAVKDTDSEPAEFHAGFSSESLMVLSEGRTALIPVVKNNIESVSFVSSDTETVSVDKAGAVKGIKEGEAEITMTAVPSQGSVSMAPIETKCLVRVIKDGLKLSLKEKAVKWTGRDFETQKGVCCYNSTSGLELRFYGTYLKAKITSAGDKTPRLAVLVDGETDPSDEKNLVTLSKDLAEKEYTLCENLEEGIHTVRILKITEAYTTSVAYSSAETDGYFLSPPKPKKYRFEIYGDSITVGHLNMRSTPNETGGDPDNVQNGCMTYIWLAAEKAGAELSVFARTGIGVNSSWGLPVYMKELWNKTFCSEHDYINTGVPNPGWEFNQKTDIVFINIGTNDALCHCDKDFFITETVRMIERMRTVYDGDTEFVLLYGIMERGYTKPALEEVCDELIQKGMLNIRCKKLPPSAEGHPRTEDNKNISLKLSDIIDEILN